MEAKEMVIESCLTHGSSWFRAVPWSISLSLSLSLSLFGPSVGSPYAAFYNCFRLLLVQFLNGCPCDFYGANGSVWCVAPVWHQMCEGTPRICDLSCRMPCSPAQRLISYIDSFSVFSGQLWRFSPITRIAPGLTQQRS